MNSSHSMIDDDDDDDDDLPFIILSQNMSVSEGDDHIRACDVVVLKAIVGEAIKEGARDGHDVNLLSLLDAYERVLPQHGVKPDGDLHYYQALLELSLQPGVDWSVRLSTALNRFDAAAVANQGDPTAERNDQRNDPMAVLDESTPIVSELWAYCSGERSELDEIPPPSLPASRDVSPARDDANDAPAGVVIVSAVDDSVDEYLARVHYDVMRAAFLSWNRTALASVRSSIAKRMQHAKSVTFIEQSCFRRAISSWKAYMSRYRHQCEMTSAATSYWFNRSGHRFLAVMNGRLALRRRAAHVARRGQLFQRARALTRWRTSFSSRQRILLSGEAAVWRVRRRNVFFAWRDLNTQRDRAERRRVQIHLWRWRRVAQARVEPALSHAPAVRALLEWLATSFGTNFESAVHPSDAQQTRCRLKLSCPMRWRTSSQRSCRYQLSIAQHSDLRCSFMSWRAVSRSDRARKRTALNAMRVALVRVRHLAVVSERSLLRHSYGRAFQFWREIALHQRSYRAIAPRYDALNKAASRRVHFRAWRVVYKADMHRNRVRCKGLWLQWVARIVEWRQHRSQNAQARIHCQRAMCRATLNIWATSLATSINTDTMTNASIRRYETGLRQRYLRLWARLLISSAARAERGNVARRLLRRRRLEVCIRAWVRALENKQHYCRAFDTSCRWFERTARLRGVDALRATVANHHRAQRVRQLADEHRIIAQKHCGLQALHAAWGVAQRRAENRLRVVRHRLLAHWRSWRRYVRTSYAARKAGVLALRRLFARLRAALRLQQQCESRSLLQVMRKRSMTLRRFYVRRWIGALAHTIAVRRLQFSSQLARTARQLRDSWHLWTGHFHNMRALSNAARRFARDVAARRQRRHLYEWLGLARARTSITMTGVDLMERRSSSLAHAMFDRWRCVLATRLTLSFNRTQLLNEFRCRLQARFFQRWHLLYSDRNACHVATCVLVLLRLRRVWCRWHDRAHVLQRERNRAHQFDLLFARAMLRRAFGQLLARGHLVQHQRVVAGHLLAIRRRVVLADALREWSQYCRWALLIESTEAMGLQWTRLSHFNAWRAEYRARCDRHYVVTASCFRTWFRWTVKLIPVRQNVRHLVAASIDRITGAALGRWRAQLQLVRLAYAHWAKTRKRDVLALWRTVCSERQALSSFERAADSMHGRHMVLRAMRALQTRVRLRRRRSVLAKCRERQKLLRAWRPWRLLTQLAILAGRSRRRLLLHVLADWRQARRDCGPCRQVRENRSRSLRRTMLAVWRWRLSQLGCLYAATAKMGALRVQRAQLGAVRFWHAYVHENEVQRRRLATAEKFCAISRRRRAVQALCALRRYRYGRHELANSRQFRFIKCTVFKRWWSCVVRRQQHGQIASQLRLLPVRLLLRRWRWRTARRLAIGASVRRLFLGRVFIGWRRYSRQRLALRDTARSQAKRMLETIGRRALARWRVEWQACKMMRCTEALIESVRRRALLRATTRSWVDAYHIRRHDATMASLVDYARPRLLLIRGYTALLGSYRLNCRFRVFHELSCRRRIRALRYMCFSRWCTRYDEQCQRRHQEKLASHWHRRSLWRQWSRRFQAVRTFARTAHIHQRYVQSGVLQCWRAALAVATCVRQHVSRQAIRRQAKVWVAWRSFQDNRRRRARERDELSAHLMKKTPWFYSVLRCVASAPIVVFRAWLLQALMSRRLNELGASVRAIRVAGDRQRVWRVWIQRDIAIKYTKRFALLHEGIALRRWVQWAGAHRQRQATIASACAHFRHTTLSRIFATWQDRLLCSWRLTGLARTLQSLQVQHRQRNAFLHWFRLFLDARHIADAETRANSHRRLYLQRRAFNGLRAEARYAATRLAYVATRARQYEQGMQACCFDGWRRYVSDRQRMRYALRLTQLSAIYMRDVFCAWRRYTRLVRKTRRRLCASTESTVKQPAYR